MEANSGKELANELVRGLRESLAAALRPYEELIWSVCVTGSYARGDFVENSSDIDLHVILSPAGAGQLHSLSSTLRRAVNSSAARILGARTFYSYNPDGIDLTITPWADLPKRQADIPLPSGDRLSYPYLGLFLFDYLAHAIVIWGHDPREVLPAPLDFTVLAKAWLESTPKRHALLLRRSEDWRLPFWAMRSVLVAQAVLGELTIDRRRVLPLYQEHVPEFPLKRFGESLLLARAAERLPSRGCRFEPFATYAAFELQLAEAVLGRIGAPRERDRTATFQQETGAVQ